MVAESAEITCASIGAMGDLLLCPKKPGEAALCGFAKGVPVQFRRYQYMVQVSPYATEVVCAPFVVQSFPVCGHQRYEPLGQGSEDFIARFSVEIAHYHYFSSF